MSDRQLARHPATGRSSDRRTAAAARVLLAATLALTPAASPTAAQTVWGSRGFTWQPEMQLAKEEMARLQAGLDRLTREEWRHRSLAWLEVESRDPMRLAVTESWRVADLQLRKKASVTPLDDPRFPSAWEVVFEGKRPQPSMAVVMTDTGSTRVACPLGAVMEEGGALGVFQHQGVLVCLAREPESGNGR